MSHPFAQFITSCNDGVQYFNNGVLNERYISKMCNKKYQRYANIIVTKDERANACDTLTKESSCQADDVCDWSNSDCVQSTCIKICSKSTCNANTRCYWNTTYNSCRKITCQGLNEAKCNQNSKDCVWDRSVTEESATTAACATASSTRARPTAMLTPTAASGIPTPTPRVSAARTSATSVTRLTA